MSYFDLYKKRVGQGKSNTLEIREATSKRQINQNFTNIHGYRKAEITEVYGKESYTTDVVATSVSSALEKIISFRPDHKVVVGSYVSYSDKTYIIREVDDDGLSPKTKCFLCNQRITFKDYGVDIPCYANSTTYGSKGIMDTGKFYELDSKTKIYIQRNMYTDSLKVGQRIMFANRYVYKITEIDDVVFSNMFIAVAIRDEVLPMDDFENNHAYNEHDYDDKESELPNSKIVGENKIVIGSEYLYTINSQSGVWSIDDTSYATLTEENGNAKLCALKTGWITLYYHCDDIEVDSLDIFIVK